MRCCLQIRADPGRSRELQHQISRPYLPLWQADGGGSVLVRSIHAGQAAIARWREQPARSGCQRQPLLQPLVGVPRLQQRNSAPKHSAIATTSRRAAPCTWGEANAAQAWGEAYAANNELKLAQRAFHRALAVRQHAAPKSLQKNQPTGQFSTAMS